MVDLYLTELDSNDIDASYADGELTISVDCYYGIALTDPLSKEDLRKLIEFLEKVEKEMK